MIVLEIILWVIFFVASAFASASITYAIWWVTGEPQSLGNGKAIYIPGRIFSHIGRKLVDWFERWEEKENTRLKKIALDILSDNGEEDKEYGQTFYKVNKEQKRANPSKAFGVCPVCMGTYISLLLSVFLICVLGFFISLWFFYLSPLIVVYHWAISLVFIDKVHLA